MAQHTLDIDAGSVILETGRELSEAEQTRLADVIATELMRLDRLAETAIHPVHLEDAYEATEDVREDGTVVIGRILDPKYHACPDCGASVIGGNSPSVPFPFLACYTIPAGPLDPKDRPCHEGCLVACGVAQ